MRFTELFLLFPAASSFNNVMPSLGKRKISVPFYRLVPSSRRTLLLPKMMKENDQDVLFEDDPLADGVESVSWLPSVTETASLKYARDLDVVRSINTMDIKVVTNP